MAGAEGPCPHGIAATPDGQIWYVSLAGSFLARVDMETGATTVVEPAEPGTAMQRLPAGAPVDAVVDGLARR